MPHDGTEKVTTLTMTSCQLATRQEGVEALLVVDYTIWISFHKHESIGGLTY